MQGRAERTSPNVLIKRPLTSSLRAFLLFSNHIFLSTHPLKIHTTNHPVSLSPKTLLFFHSLTPHTHSPKGDVSQCRGHLSGFLPMLSPQHPGVHSWAALSKTFHSSAFCLHKCTSPGKEWGRAHLLFPTSFINSREQGQSVLSTSQDFTICAV